MDNNLNSMANALGFEKWLQFCEDFNLRSSMNNTPILTSIELSEIFLSSVKAHIVDHIGRLTFDEFWEDYCKENDFDEEESDLNDWDNEDLMQVAWDYILKNPDKYRYGNSDYDNEEIMNYNLQRI